MRKVINKGYTLTVTSWENDADNYKTNSTTVDSKEKARVLYDLMQLCVSKNNQPKGVIRLGNTPEEGFDKNQIILLEQFFKENHILSQESLDNKDNMSKDDWRDYITTMFYEIEDGLLGSSEYYACRVMDSCVVTYSPEDVYLEEIKF